MNQAGPALRQAAMRPGTRASAAACKSLLAEEVKARIGAGMPDFSGENVSNFRSAAPVVPIGPARP